MWSIIIINDAYGSIKSDMLLSDIVSFLRRDTMVSNNIYIHYVIYSILH